MNHKINYVGTLLAGLVMAVMLAACGGNDTLKDKASYTKTISGKWRPDTVFMAKELREYMKGWEAVAENKKSESKEGVAFMKAMLEAFTEKWVRQMGGWWTEFTPDGAKRDKQDKNVVNGKYGFSEDLDTLYFRAITGEINDRFKIDKLTGKELVIMWPMGDPLTNEVTFVRFKYIKDDESIKKE